MRVDSKCAVTMPLSEMGLEWTDVTPAIEGANAANERARFARARLKADTERLLPRRNAERATLQGERSPLGDTSGVAPVVVRLVRSAGVGRSDVPGTVDPVQK